MHCGWLRPPRILAWCGSDALVFDIWCGLRSLATAPHCTLLDVAEEIRILIFVSDDQMVVQQYRLLFVCLGFFCQKKILVYFSFVSYPSRMCSFFCLVCVVLLCCML